MTVETAVLERWARTRKYWGRPTAPAPLPEWSVVIIGEVVTVFHGVKDATRQWDLDALTALLWAAAVESGVMIDVGPCHACEGDGHQVLVATAVDTKGRRWAQPRAWSDLDVSEVPLGPKSTQWTAARPCPACTVDGQPTGRERKPRALLVCEAAPKPGGFDEYVEDHGWLGQEPRKEWYPPEPGDPAAREALVIEADRLQSPSAPTARGVRPDLESQARSTEHLGVWLSAWLRGECQSCDGRSSICDHQGGGEIRGYGCSDCMNTGHLCASPCETCHGHGELLGAHVDAMVAVLDAAQPKSSS